MGGPLAAQCRVLSLLLLTLLLQTVAADNITTTPSTRVRRQAMPSPQLVPGPPGKLNVPIPTSIAVFGGSSTKAGKCDRDEVPMMDGICQRLLARGNCLVDEEVLLNPENNEGYCAPILCPPDRVFIFSTQLCHDPQEMNICPLGRELYVSSFGTPVCQCPDGTYEGDEDLDDDVCEPILGQIPNCPPGQVFWFRSLDLGPECVPDPCGGLNVNRGPNDLPFLPSFVNGRCFQMGASDGVCPKNTWYGLDMKSLKGVCDSLEDYGYNVYNAEELKTLINDFGTPITGNNASPVSTNTPAPNVIGHTVTSSVSQTSQVQTISSPQIISSQPIHQITEVINPQPTNPINHVTTQATNQINQLQQQINLLQQQLNQLQQNTGKVSTTPQGSSQTSQRNTGFSSQNQFESHSSGSPIVIKAPLLSKITNNSPASTTPHVFRHASQNTAINNNGFHRTTQQSSTASAPFQSHHTSPQSHSFTQSTTNHNQGQGHSQVSHNFNSQNVPVQLNNQQPMHSQQSHMNPMRPNQLQIQLGGPLDIVHFQNQQNSIEDIGVFYDQPFHNSGMQQVPMFHSDSMPFFQPGRSNIIQTGHSQHHFANNGFSPNFSIESQFNGGFVSHSNHRGKRAAPPKRRKKPSGPKRIRRSPLPHASPSNVFESRLLSCRGGAARDINAKCRNTILPSRLPKRSVRRPSRPIPPRRPCSGVFNIFRRCVSSSASAASSVNAFALG